MKKLSEDLKKMLAGLACQDASDYLSISEKMKVLGGSQNNQQKLPPSAGHASRPSTRRIAFISDGSGLHAPLDYAIDAGIRQNAQIDLLIHGTADSERISALLKKIKDAGVNCQRVQFDTDVTATDGIIEYIFKHPSLIYLIAKSDDDAARTLVEDLLPRYRRRIQVPVVLIEDQNTAGIARQSAA